jgi:hypothetical protein
VFKGLKDQVDSRSSDLRYILHRRHAIHSTLRRYEIGTCASLSPATGVCSNVRIKHLAAAFEACQARIAGPLSQLSRCLHTISLDVCILGICVLSALSDREGTVETLRRSVTCRVALRACRQGAASSGKDATEAAPHHDIYGASLLSNEPDVLSEHAVTEGFRKRSLAGVLRARLRRRCMYSRFHHNALELSTHS